MFGAIFSPQAFFASTIVTAIAQVVPSGDLGGLGAQIERGGLTVMLVVGIGVLWRTLVKKDDQITSMTKACTEALVAVTDTQRELRASQEKLMTELRKAA